MNKSMGCTGIAQEQLKFVQKRVRKINIYKQNIRTVSASLTNCRYETLCFRTFTAVSSEHIGTRAKVRPDVEFGLPKFQAFRTKTTTVIKVRENHFD